MLLAETEQSVISFVGGADLRACVGWARFFFRRFAVLRFSVTGYGMKLKYRIEILKTYQLWKGHGGTEKKKDL